MRNKRQALSAARLHVSIYRWGRDWAVSRPWDVRKWGGACTVVQHPTYARARASAAAAVAEVAAAMLGRYGDEARYAIWDQSTDPYADRSARALLDAGLRAERGQ